jgi:hypothetical protein
METQMLSKIATAAALVLVLGTASAALADENTEERGGGAVQSWQDIQQSQQSIQHQLDLLGRNESGNVSAKHRPSH